MLDILLRFQLSKYASEGVNYVEFSVGFGDLVKRPWIFTHLSNPTVEDLPFGDTKVPPIPDSIVFFYLAGFNRRAVKPCLDLENKHETLSWAHNVATTSNADILSSQFQEHFSQLRVLKEKFAESREATHAKVPTLHDACVGLDFFGDEWRYPHCPFGLPEFTNFLFDERRQRAGHFGFRIHGGELCHYDQHDWAFVAHMGVVSCTITKILKAYETYLGTTRHTKFEDVGIEVPPIRIGHGIGFDCFLDRLATQVADNNSPLAKLEAEVPFALKMLLDHHIPIEVNLTSNRLLQGTTQASNEQLFNPDFLLRCLQKGYRAILCTDNDGIWPIKFATDGSAFSSVPGELMRSIEGSNSDAPLDHARVEQLMKNYESAAFGDPSEPVCGLLSGFGHQQECIVRVA